MLCVTAKTAIAMMMAVADYDDYGDGASHVDGDYSEDAGDHDGDADVYGDSEDKCTEQTHMHIAHNSPVYSFACVRITIFVFCKRLPRPF